MCYVYYLIIHVFKRHLSSLIFVNDVKKFSGDSVTCPPSPPCYTGILSCGSLAIREIISIWSLAADWIIMLLSAAVTQTLGPGHHII